MRGSNEHKGSLAGKLSITTALGYALWETYPIVLVSRHAREWSLYAWSIGAALFVAGVSGIAHHSGASFTAAIRTFRAFRPKLSDQSATWLTVKEARQAGLTGSEGLFTGILDGHPTFIKSFVHALVCAPSRSGKTTSFTLPALLHDPGHSRVVTDFNGEATQQCAAAIRAQGHELVVLDPADLTGEGSGALNPLDVILRDLATEPQDAMADARSLASALHPGPSGPHDPFWPGGTKKLLTLGEIALCVPRSPDEANLPNMYGVLSDDDALETLLLEASDSEALGGELAALARNIMAIRDSTPKIFESFREGAIQNLVSFGPSSRIAPVVKHSTFDPAMLKARKITLVFGCDGSRMDQYEAWLKVTLWAVLKGLVRVGDARPVWFLLDEFTNYPLHGIPQALTGLASSGIHLAIILQELQELERVYGRDALKTVLSQTDVKLFFGASGDTARLLAEYLGDEEIITESYSLGRDLDEAPGLSLGRMKRALLAAAKIREMPTDETLAIIRNLKPPRLLRAGFHEVMPWREIVSPSRRFGGKRHIGTLKMVIKRGRARATRSGIRQTVRTRLPVWRPIWGALRHFMPGLHTLALGAAFVLVLLFGFPQLLWEYTASRSWCQYLSLPFIAEPVTLLGRDHCPVLLWVKPGGVVQ